MTEEIIPPDQVVEALASGTAAAPEPADQVEVKSTPASKPAYPAHGILLPAAERADWSVYCNLNTLPQRAGVPIKRLRRLVLKELVDNALDAAD